MNILYISSWHRYSCLFAFCFRKRTGKNACATLFIMLAPLS
jgi:hypothetical protein